MSTSAIAIVGAGPRGAGLLERLLANMAELLPDAPVDVHVIEPFPFGAGRIWRWDQSSLLWANSQAEDMTMFTDASCRIDGPIRPGPTFDEWTAHRPDAVRLSAELAGEADRVGGLTFASRRLVHEYLTWFFWRTVATAPENVRIHLHAARVVRLTEHDGRQALHLSDRGEPLTADIVLLAQGHLPTEALGESAELDELAQRRDLVHISEEYTADADLSRLVPGERAIVRGAGLAFVDLAVLVGQGRGGRYQGDPLRPESLRYKASGQEPRLLVGSRRGVPYRSKITYRLQGSRAPHPFVLTPDTITSLLEHREGEPGYAGLDFRTDLWPLLAKELALGYYHELFHAHPERTTVPWQEFRRAVTELDWAGGELTAAVTQAVPAAEDRLDFDTLDRPLSGLRFTDDAAGAAALHEHVIAHVEADLRRRRNPHHSADLGLFNALLAVIEPLVRILGSGRLSVASQLLDVPWFFGFFSYYASGPPPQRLGELLALARAGVITFVGSDLEVTTGPAYFEARSPASGHAWTARTLVEARLPRTSLPGTRDALLTDLLRRGEVSEQTLTDSAGTPPVPSGRLRVDPRTCQVLDLDGRAHPGRYAFGAATTAATAGAFSRPGTDAAFFRQNDFAVRHAVRTLAERGGRGRRPAVAITRPRGRAEHTIRTFRDARHPAAAAALAEALREDASRHSPSYPGPQDLVAPQATGTAPPPEQYLLLMDGERAVGLAVHGPDQHPGTGRLRLLWTAPTRRGQGLGRLLLERVQDEAATAGRTNLTASVGPRHPEFTRLLRAAGWTAESATDQYSANLKAIAPERIA